MPLDLGMQIDPAAQVLPVPSMEENPFAQVPNPLASPAYQEDKARRLARMRRALPNGIRSARDAGIMQNIANAPDDIFRRWLEMHSDENVRNNADAYMAAIRQARINKPLPQDIQQLEGKARVLRGRIEAMKKTGSLPKFNSQTPQQDLDSLKYGVPLGATQFNMPSGPNVALDNKLARADAALANTMSAGTPAMRANPATRQLARFRNMVAADAARPAAPAPVVREWDQDLLDRIHRKNYGLNPPIEVRNGAPDAGLVGNDVPADGAGRGLMAVPAEPRRGKPKPGSPAYRRMEQMRQRVAREQGRNVNNVSDEDVSDAMESRRNESKVIRQSTEAERRNALNADIQKRKEARQNGGASGGDRYHNTFMLGLQTGNTDLMNKALEGYTESEKTKALTDAAAEDRKLEREKRDQQFKLTMAHLEAEKQARQAEAKRQEMLGNQREAAEQRRHAENIAQTQAGMAQNDQHHKERLAEGAAKNKPLTRDEYATSISNSHTPDEVKQMLDEWDNAHAEPGGAGAPAAPSRVERDMAAGKMTDDVYNEMRSLHPADLWHPDWNPFVGEEPYKHKLFRHFNSLYPNVPPAQMKALIGRYFIRHRNE